MSTLDEIAGAGPSEITARTPHEEHQDVANLIDDMKALEEAEKVSRGLRPGEHRWTCPGCSVTWTGVMNGHQHLAYKSHIQRHAHARFPQAAEVG